MPHRVIFDFDIGTFYQRQMSDTKRPPQTIGKELPVMAERGTSFDP